MNRKEMGRGDGGRRMREVEYRRGEDLGKRLMTQRTMRRVKRTRKTRRMSTRQEEKTHPLGDALPLPTSFKRRIDNAASNPSF